jgi:hypothetical protein
MTEVIQQDARTSELLQLQREYRHMELNRRAYAEESQALLRKQQTTIDKMRKDSDGLKNEIAMILRASNRATSSAQSAENLQRLHDTGDKYANVIDFERQNIQTMEEQIQIMKQKILHQRRAMGGVNASKDNHYMIQKQIRILENRLEKALVKFNEAISHNKTLRDNIDDLRRERIVFENIYRKMERELQDRKRQMAEVIELSNQSYEQRDTYQMEIAAIEQANRKEQEEFEEQMMELGRMLETDLKLPAPGARTGTASGGKTTMRLDTGSKESGSPSKSKSMGGGGDMLSLERIQNFEEAFNKIKGATGITDIEELVRTFIKNEEHNFSLFNYVNEQNNEIERYEEQVAALRDEERKFTQESGEDVNQQKQILKELESKLQSTEAAAEKYEMKCQDLQRVIESLKRGTHSLIDKFDFDGEGFGDQTVTEMNMVHYLGLIEQKVNAMITMYSDLKEQVLKPVSKPQDESPSKSMFSVLGAGPKVPMGQELLHVNPPKFDDYNSEDDDDDDDDDTRPLTRDELKARTLNRLRKGAGAKAGGKKKKSHK